MIRGYCYIICFLRGGEVSAQDFYRRGREFFARDLHCDKPTEWGEFRWAWRGWRSYLFSYSKYSHVINHSNYESVEEFDCSATISATYWDKKVTEDKIKLYRFEYSKVQLIEYFKVSKIGNIDQWVYVYMWLKKSFHVYYLELIN